MEVVREEIEGILILRLAGRMDLEAYPELKKTIDLVLRQSSHKVLINLKDVILISSSGVGALVNLGRDLEKEGGQMALVELSQVCRQVIDFLRLEDVLLILPDEAQGIKFLKEQS